MRNAERQGQLYEQTILPLAQQALNSSEASYTSGTLGYADFIDSQRTLLNVRLMTARVRIEREKRLAELEALAGRDLETLTQPTTQPATTQPSTALSVDVATDE